MAVADISAYKSLHDNITKYIAKTDEIYKTLQTPAEHHAAFSTDLTNISNPHDYRIELWLYFTTRYHEQTALKDHYFTLENTLLDKQQIIKKQLDTIQREHDTLVNTNQRAISNLHTDKYQLHSYANTSDVYKTFAISLLCTILTQIFNIIGIISNNITIIIVTCIIIINAIIISYNWYRNSYRTNTQWDLLNYTPVPKNDSQQCTPQFVKTGPANNTELDAKINALAT